MTPHPSDQQNGLFVRTEVQELSRASLASQVRDSGQAPRAQADRGRGQGRALRMENLQHLALGGFPQCD